MRLGIVLMIVLAAYWFGLSGYTKPLILGLGAASILITTFMCYRMKILDEETVPYMSLPKTISYFYWLFREIVKANMTVVRAVMKPIYDISPTLVEIPSPQTTELGRTMFANSITLTPGTVAVDMGEESILVHALLSEMSDPNDFVEMGKRSAWAIGETRPADEKEV